MVVRATGVFGPNLRTMRECIAAFGLMFIALLQSASATESPSYDQALKFIRDGDPKAAREALTTAHNEGDVRATSGLGEFLWFGDGGPPDPERGCDYFELAGRSDIPSAVFNYANCFFLGRGRAQDYGQSKHYYERAIELGVSKAYCALGNQFRSGLGVETDLRRAKDLCRQGAEAGEPDAQTDLGEMLLDERKFEEAARWLRPAAEAGQVNAMHHLGVMLMNGDGVQRDRNAAKDWLVKSANAGNRAAPYLIGRLFYDAGVDEEKRQLEPDLAWVAGFWFSVAADLHPNPGVREDASVIASSLHRLLPREYAARIDETLAKFRDKGLGPYNSRPRAAARRQGNPQ